MDILVVAPYEELKDKIDKVAKELGYRIKLVHGDLEIGLEKARHAIKEDPNLEVIISRGGTANLIENELDKPVIPIDISTYDLLDSISKAKKHGNRIGVVGFKNIIHGSVKLGRYLDVEITEIEIKDSKEAQNLSSINDNLNLDVIIGDNISVKLSKEYGIKSMRIESGDEAIGIALHKGKILSNALREEKIQSKQLLNIVEGIYEGVIAANKDGIIELANNKAMTMLRKNRSDLIGKSIDEIIKKDIYMSVKKGKKAILGETLKINEVLLVHNISPILIKNEIEGYTITLNNIEDIEGVETKVRNKIHLKGHVAIYKFKDIITKNGEMSKLIDVSKRYSKSDYTVLINGESGTGKELFAQSIHNYSIRKNEPFVAINMAAMPENLLESELFGYEEGAFTGAKKGGKKGLFELAHNGTLFLDEIGEISLLLQSRLLRALQEKTIMRVGGDNLISIDTRVIAATHRNLIEAVEKGTFRRDLYYRLNVLNIEIPSLDKRVEDIPLLVISLNEKICMDLKFSKPYYKDETLEYLKTLNYEGNIRQLENIMTRVAVLYPGEEIGIDKIKGVLEDRAYKEGEDILLRVGNLKEMELEIINKIYEYTSKDKNRTLEILGISDTTLWRRLKEI